MKFCPDCENFLYVLEDSTEGMGFKCRKCPYIEKISHENPLVYEHKLKEDRATQLIMNENLEHDPTLPRFTTIRCPTQGCPSNDVVAVKLSREDVVWMYKCAICKVAWKQSARR